MNLSAIRGSVSVELIVVVPIVIRFPIIILSSLSRHNLRPTLPKAIISSVAQVLPNVAVSFFFRTVSLRSRRVRSRHIYAYSNFNALLPN